MHICSDLSLQIHGIRKAKGRHSGRVCICWQEIQSSSNAFYEALDSVLCTHEFGLFVEEACQEFYAERMGRSGLAPGV